MGSVIKGISGNLDNEDGSKIYSILNHLKDNQNNLQSQLKMQYSVNQEIVDKFNNVTQNIEHNEILLKSRIIQLNSIIKENTEHIDILLGKDLFNQLIIIYNTILNILQEIETSLTFCKLHTLHPSIIKSDVLLSEITKISQFYKNQLPFAINHENILNFESIIEVNCKIKENIIHYFLTLPIYLEKQFELFHLLSIPTKFESEFRTIIPDTNYLIKSDDTVKPLTGICTRNKIYHCPNHILKPQQSPCGEEILISGKSTNCEYTKLNIKNSHVEYIFEINQYLAIFPTIETVKTICTDKTETKQLKGIYLIKNNNCQLFINDQEIFYSGKSYGNPTLIQYQGQQLKNSQLSNITINLKNLQLNKLSIPDNTHLIPFTDQYLYNLHLPSIWTIILYVIIIIACIFLCLKFRKIYQHIENIQKESSHIPTVQPRSHNSTIHLPEEASF